LGWPIRVLLADDHAVVRRGLRLFLELQEGIEVVGEAADGAEAAALAGSARPDVVVMDLSMPGVDGIEATRLVRGADGAAKVLVLSSFVDERVLPALRAGAEGYLTKDSEPAELAAAIRSVHAGEPVFCKEALQRLTRELVRGQLRPEGTVTIAFTDVEDSTGVLERLGEKQARELFREHDELVRSAVAEHGGVEVEKEGDAFMLAFSGARPGVHCAAAIQRALGEQSLRVRIGLNTGDVIAEEAGYFGRTVFLASRVAGAAAGGEILVSDVTRALAGDQPELRFVDRGEHELKGFAGRHRLWQVEW
jgi:DNA-binding NarL/FixJ family response regulator